MARNDKYGMRSHAQRVRPPRHPSPSLILLPCLLFHVYLSIASSRHFPFIRRYGVILEVVVLILHVAIALAGLTAATYGLVVPSQTKLRATYGLTATTFASGTYLAVRLHSPILQSCVSGLAYLGFILAATLAARHRLARQYADA